LALMHFAQAKTLFPEGSLNHCKFGRCLRFTVGLYFPRSFTLRQTNIDPFPQI